MNMEHKLQKIIVVFGCICILVAPVCADTYRWKDKEGKTHYGATVPAEYADQPYDVLNNAGMVIDRIEDTREPLEVRAERIVKERAPLISDEERKRQSDRLLVIQYRSEKDIHKALELELAQLGYDSKIIHQSFDSTTTAIREQVRTVADQQRAGVPVNDEKQKQIEKLYRRLERDGKRLATLDSREARIQARFQSELERYRQLTSESEEREQELRRAEARSDQS